MGGSLASTITSKLSGMMGKCTPAMSALLKKAKDYRVERNAGVPEHVAGVDADREEHEANRRRGEKDEARISEPEHKLFYHEAGRNGHVFWSYHKPTLEAHVKKYDPVGHSVYPMQVEKDREGKPFYSVHIRHWGVE